MTEIDPGSIDASDPDSEADSLTCIRGRIHSGAASQGGGDDEEDPSVEHFLDTLVDVAFAIATRQANRQAETAEQKDKRMK